MFEWLYFFEVTHVKECNQPLLRKNETNISN